MQRFVRELMRGRIIMQVTDDEHDAIQQYAKTTPSTVHAQYCPNSPSDSHATVSPASTVQQCLDASSDPCIILEKKELVDVNGTPCMDEGGDFISRLEVETSNEQLADHQEPMFGEEGTTTETKSGGNWVQADITQDTTTAVRVATCVVTAIDQHRQGTMTSDENEQFDPGGGRETFPFPMGTASPRPLLFFFPVLGISLFLCVCFLACIFACLCKF